MRVKITDVGAPFYHEGEIGFNVGVKFDEMRTSAFVHPSDDLNLVLSKVVNEAIKDKTLEDAAVRFSQEVKKLIGTEMEVP